MGPQTYLIIMLVSFEVHEFEVDHAHDLRIRISDLLVRSQSVCAGPKNNDLATCGMS